MLNCSQAMSEFISDSSVRNKLHSGEGEDRTWKHVEQVLYNSAFREWCQKRAGVKRLVKPAGWLEVYMGRGISSTLGRFAGLRRCGLGAT